MIDKVSIHVKAGKGGDGAESFLKKSPYKMIPVGGNGGKGGDIVFIADNNVNDLSYFKYNPDLKAKSGMPGGKNNKTGKGGADMILRVPVGTSVINNETGCLIRNFSKSGEEVIVARGGKGGHGNCEHRVRTFGKSGEEFDITLDYKIVAGIALIGLPNSGKSTLLASLTAAKVNLERYPFSTRFPQLGSYMYDDYHRVTICDLPSVTEGAGKGKGRGNRFLKHALSSKLLFLLIDGAGGDVSGDLKILQKELILYNDSFPNKDSFIVVNLTEGDYNDKTIEKYENDGYICISFKDKKSLTKLMDKARPYL